MAGVSWFIAISYLMAHTGYQNTIVETLSSDGAATSLVTVLSILISFLSLFPGGLTLAYACWRSAKGAGQKLGKGTLALSVAITLALYVLFGWYNFAVNYPT